MQVQLEQRDRRCRSCEAPKIWNVRTSGGGAHRLHHDRGFFFDSVVFVPGDEELGFMFYGKDHSKEFRMSCSLY